MKATLYGDDTVYTMTEIPCLSCLLPGLLPVIPEFVNTPQNIRVRAGDPAFLECLVEGRNNYLLTWYNKGKVK